MNRRTSSAGWLLASLLVISACNGDSDSGSSASAGPDVCCGGTKIAFSSDRNGGFCDGKSDSGQPPFGTPCQANFDCGTGGTCVINTEIYVMEANGSDAQRITDSPLADLQPVWSPDYTQIAFTSERAGKTCRKRSIFGPPSGTPCETDSDCGLSNSCIANSDIYVTASDGSGTATRLTDNPTSDLDPAWSPDGLQLLFSSDKDQGAGGDNFEVYACTLPADVSQITTDYCEDPLNRTQLTASTNQNSFAPSWSPDGSQIVFWKTNQGPPPTKTGVLYTMDANGDNQTMLSESISSDDYAPSWSPDGTKLAYYSLAPVTGNVEIYVCTMPACDDHTKLTEASANDNNPTWSPDSSQIAYSSTNSDGNRIAVIDADGSNPTFVSSAGRFPAWQPPPSP